ncbi:bifunctional riboflavin kinase/FAD synthetase [Fastidiosibacter lacustris]|uniref:bifunctional riboflavin kinase/FAD synthetase n=1 Tax=Fastidiosibacter lacustris TaxID=2056695 RepID=UPI000E34E620|nr:bifunctional riboflavin kinase/FAD synthetase [Fastidiosibacter lacustris]
MRLLRFADLNSSKNKTPSVVTIGNFDGMHLGHQSILNHVAKLAKTLRLTSNVICFEPQPKEFFLKDQAPPRITPFRDKLQALQKHHIDQVLCLAFNQKLASLDPHEFIEKILVYGLNAKHVIVGDDFRFGHKREGDFTLLKELGLKFGFNVESLPSFVQNGGVRVSSSYIRILLQQGNFEQAQTLLGHSYTLSGRIHHGNQNGRKLGFPTINIPMPTQVVVSGVYVVNIHLKGQVYQGIANIGVRPTVCGRLRLLETYIFNFAHDLYGQYVTIEFLQFLRGEKKFSGFEELKLQIEQDKTTALSWLKQHNLITHLKV